jgi:hypothetical protein
VNEESFLPIPQETRVYYSGDGLDEEGSLRGALVIGVTELMNE